MFVSNDVIQSSGVGFGTSGARGLVTQFTTNVCAAFTHAFVAVMAENFKFERIALAIDNRPSSYAMAQACAAALKQRNIEPVYYGVIPTPALAYSAMQQNIPCIMVTGSHIPFDRNGLKFYRPDGEITKLDEEAIISSEVEFESLSELAELGVDNTALTMYIERYTSMFSSDMLSGKRIGIYEHSSAGRDIYADLFSAMGAEVISLERTDKFVPIDTEAVAEADFVKSRTWANEHKLDAIFSTDGDGDRPLVSDENGEWLRGDMLGLLTAAKLGIDALAIPVSCNTAIEASNAFKYIKRTRIGSPYVIAELEQLSHSYNAIAGFEANGGFLLGCDIDVNGKVLKALPTRDAVLPAIILLAAVGDKTVSMLVDSLPKRFTSSNRIQNFATKRSSEIIATGVKQPDTLLAKLGFNGLLASIDITDGLRMILVDGRIIHLRPSGNAPELRCYAEASDIHTAQLLVRQTLEKVQTIY